MVFKNEKQLKDFLMTKCKNAVIKAQEQVYQIIDRLVKEFYEEYIPDVDHGGYERTYQLFRSLVKSDIVPTNNGYKAEVYVDLNYLNYIYPNGSQPSGKDVMDAAAKGEHGVEYVAYHGTAIWNKYELDAKAIDILVDMLRAEGITVIKG